MLTIFLMSSPKVLTLYLCKNQSDFSYLRFLSVMNQWGIKQRIFIVSAEPIRAEVPNIVVTTRKEWLLPVRVGFSVNVALRMIHEKNGISLRDFDYIFKVDSDLLLPRDYVYSLTSRRAIVGGVGAALLISVPFFMKATGGKYPINYCDDGYIFALSVSKGIWPVSYHAKKLLVPPVIFDYKREFAYGVEYYKWGLSPIMLLMVLIFSRFVGLRPHEKRSIKAHIHNIAGYMWAFLHRVEKYHFWRDYRRMRNRHFAEKVLKLVFYFAGMT